MKKILLIAMLIVGMCLSATVAQGVPGDHGFTDVDVVRVHGTTGNAKLLSQKLTFHFPPNLQPGELLSVKWWIKNDGNCPLWVTVTLSGKPSWLIQEFLPGYSFELGKGLYKNVALVVKMLQSVNQAQYQNRSFTITVTFTSRSLAKRWQWPTLP